MPSEKGVLKLLPRNMTAWSAVLPQPAIGNPASSLLESGVGNCFPGLEVDLRNLERRFFPWLTVDFLADRPGIRVVAVDSEGVNGARLSEDDLATYRSIAAYTKAQLFWEIEVIRADFGAYGTEFNIKDFPSTQDTPPNPKLPADPWTAIRLLREGQDIQLTLKGPHQEAAELEGKRVGYFDANGALADMFSPGELAQSLCSPWTHDFRDCGCFYWASNHPDIAQPPAGNSGRPASENDRVVWLRSQRSLEDAPLPASPVDSPRAQEMGYFEINDRWQALNFVLGARETITPLSGNEEKGVPFSTTEELITALRRAAGIELAVMQEYLAAAFSLNDPSSITDDDELEKDLTAAFAEIMRIAIGEMRHLRAVNIVLRGVTPGSAFEPALRIATHVPTEDPSTTRPFMPRPVTIGTLDHFIAIERAAATIDMLYQNILATLQVSGTSEQQETIGTILAEGEDHFQAFRDIREWAARHPQDKILRSLQLLPAPPTEPRQVALDRAYRHILELLYSGYKTGTLGGARPINEARSFMVGQDGLLGHARALANAGFLVTFSAVEDPRFAPLDS